jgi:hypothetical protein
MISLTISARDVMVTAWAMSRILSVAAMSRRRIVQRLDAAEILLSPGASRGATKSAVFEGCNREVETVNLTRRCGDAEVGAELAE